MLSQFPATVDTVNALTLPDQSRRPSASELLATTFSNRRHGNNENSEASALARDQNNKTYFAVNDEAENCD